MVDHVHAFTAKAGFQLYFAGAIEGCLRLNDSIVCAQIAQNLKEPPPIFLYCKSCSRTILLKKLVSIATLIISASVVTPARQAFAYTR